MAKLKYILPSLSSVMYMLLLPVLVVAYSLFVHFNVQLGSAQSDMFSVFTENYPLMQIIGRVMDFVLWGGLAAVVLVAIWFIGVAKATLDNHYAEESFVNFSVPKSSWHSRFFIMAVVKVSLAISLACGLLMLIGRILPLLYKLVDVAAQIPSQHNIVLVLDVVLLSVLVQALIATVFKLFKYSRVE